MQLRNAFIGQQQEISNTRAVQEQPAKSASEYKDLRDKVDKLMTKTNSTIIQHQEYGENTTPSKPKGTTKKDSCA